MKLLSYERPGSLTELYETLSRQRGSVLWIAGATDVLVKERKGHPYEQDVGVDLTAVELLHEISEEEEQVRIGSCVTHGEIASSPLLRQYAPALAAACGQVGACQLRNRATIGGNIANASPAADSLAPLAALDARLLLNRMGTLRSVPVTDFITGPGKTILQDREFLQEIRLPKLPGNWHSRFCKIGRRGAMAISRLTLCAAVRLEDGGTIRDLRLAAGAVFPRPMRFEELEAWAQGRSLGDEQFLTEISEKFAGQIPLIAGRRASTTYKQPVCQLACRRLLKEIREEYETHCNQL